MKISDLIEAQHNAYCSEYIYTVKRQKLNAISVSIATFTMMVPICITVVMYIAKGEPWQPISDILIAVISGIVILVGLWPFLAGYDTRKEKYIINARENKQIATEVKKIISNKNFDNLEWFQDKISNQDKEDIGNLGILTLKMKQAAQRYALEHTNKSCSFCGGNPFQYKRPTYFKKRCQSCGMELIK